MRFRKSTPMHDAIHGKITGIAKEMCAKCRKQLDDTNPAAIYLVEYDASKTSEEDQKNNNPWRTGVTLAMKPEAFQRMFNTPLPAGQVAYVESPILTNMVKDIRGEENEET